MSSIHKALAQALSMLMNNPDIIPEWIAEGITYFFTKKRVKKMIKIIIG